MTKTAVLLGTGIFDSDMKDYKGYIDEFVEFVNRNNVGRVIVCGGQTNPDSRLTEASSIIKYMAPLLGKNVQLIAEEDSITASQSIRYSKPLLKMKKSDDVTVFCDAVLAVKVMWFIMHYWFDMDRADIEQDALNFISLYYSKHHNVEDVGRGIIHTGVLYKNVEVHPCSVRPSMESAIAQQLVSLVDIAALYNEPLYRLFIETTKKRYGIKK